jgi:alpha-glucuronidase
VHRYSHGVDEVGAMRSAWDGVAGRVDAQRFGEVSEFLEIQHYEARWWRDASLAYFAQTGSLSIPSGYAAPASSLGTYQGLDCPPNVKKPRCTQVYTGSPSPAILP